MEHHELLSTSADPPFRLGEAWVRPALDEIERDGETMRIESRSMQVLVCLARHAPAVVTREKLLEEVWQDTPFVSDEVVSHAIWELRRALGDSAREPLFIRTIPRKGYQLLVEVVRPKGAPAPSAGVRINHFEVLEELGRGAMGVVYRARDLNLNRVVALKFLAPELTRDEVACDRFLREARLAAGLDHPNLATILEIGETSDGHRYLVTPCYGGGSLADRLKQGPIPHEQAADLARQAAAGLGAAHARGIVHRDVKPANLLLDEHGTLKVADFGIAKLLGATSLTRTGASLGTPAYKSPEQSLGREVDHRTDLWSLGVVLFEMLTGRKPFEADYEQAIVHSILAVEPKLLDSAPGRQVPEELRRIVRKAMAKDPEARYQNSGEMIADLDHWRTGAVVLPHPAPLRRRALQATLGTALIASLLLAYTGSWRGPLLHLGVLGPVGEGNTAVESCLQKGNSFWLSGNTQENLAAAREQFEGASRLAPDDPAVLGRLAVFLADVYTLYRRPEDRERAEKLIIQVASLAPEEPLGWMAGGRLRFHANDLDGAETLLRQAVKRWPRCDVNDACDLAFAWLSDTLAAQKRYEEAEEILKRGLDVGGGRVRCRLKLAQLFKDTSQLPDAIVEYEKILELPGFQTTALNDLGNIYLTVGQYDDAVRAYWQLLQATDDPSVRYNYGNALYGLGSWDDAFEAYEQADRDLRARREEDPLPAIAIGDLFLEQGRTAEAGPWYRAALETIDKILDEGGMSRTHLCRRSVVLAKLGEHDKALEEVTQLLTESPKDLAVLFAAARVYALREDRAALFEVARTYLALGGEAHRLREDVAFLRFRKDAEYLAIIKETPVSAK